MSEHLGEVYERLGRSADALSAYATAQAMASAPSEPLKTRIARLAGGELPAVFNDAAQDVLMRERSVVFSLPDAAGDAEYLAIFRSSRRIADLRPLTPSNAMRGVDAKLRELEFPLEFPEKTAPPLLMKVLVRCAKRQACAAMLDFPHRVELPK